MKIKLTRWHIHTETQFLELERIDTTYYKSMTCYWFMKLNVITRTTSIAPFTHPHLHFVWLLDLFYIYKAPKRGWLFPAYGWNTRIQKRNSTCGVIISVYIIYSIFDCMFFNTQTRVDWLETLRTCLLIQYLNSLWFKSTNEDDCGNLANVVLTESTAYY